MKYLIGLSFIASVASIICGYWLEVDYRQKLIGFGVLGLFFVVIPLFTYHKAKGKKINDYMLTKENLDKMRDKEKRN